MNLKKYRDMRDIGHLCKHYSRTVKSNNYSNKEIQLDKIKDDYNLAPEREQESEYIKLLINDISTENKKTIRKDAVKMCTWIVDLPTSMKAASTEDQARFFKESYDFLVSRYGQKSGMGEDIVISAYVHNSETTPHLHFAFVPILEKNNVKNLCAKDLINRTELKECQQELAIYLQEKGICKYKDILNGATQRDERGRVKSVHDLKKERNQRSREQEKVDRWSSRSEQTYERGRW